MEPDRQMETKMKEQVEVLIMMSFFESKSLVSFFRAESRSFKLMADTQLSRSPLACKPRSLGRKPRPWHLARTVRLSRRRPTRP